MSPIAAGTLPVKIIEIVLVLRAFPATVLILTITKLFAAKLQKSWTFNSSGTKEFYHKISAKFSK